MPKITQGRGASFDPNQPVDPIEAADPKSPVPDPNTPRERPGEDGTAFAKYADTNEVEYGGRTLDYQWPDRPSLNANKPEWVQFASLVNQVLTRHLEESAPIEDPAADDVTKTQLVDAYREYGNQPGTPES